MDFMTKKFDEKFPGQPSRMHRHSITLDQEADEALEWLKVNVKGGFVLSEFVRKALGEERLRQESARFQVKLYRPRSRPIKRS